MALTEPGWAIRRNGSCLLSEEIDCGTTVKPYRACCPSSTTCPTQYNVACCPPNMNCTSAIAETPSCANSSWIMYDNGGYFCCEQGQVGYNMYGSDGCSKSGQPLPLHALPLAVVEQVSHSTSTSSSASTPISTPASTSTPGPETSDAPKPVPASNSSNNTPGGTIAGAVVGGVAGIAIIAGLIWWVSRRRKTNSGTGANVAEASGPLHDGNDGGYKYNQYYETPKTSPSEIAGTPRAELATTPIDRTEGRSEMP
ncbi:hypothetical protein F4777DRAFT_545561 [Nemania sp. FL0916]|nr:hypothetical protein F4777DRAFT_545561 [Nemania sp. FL0916]